MDITTRKFYNVKFLAAETNLQIYEYGAVQKLVHLYTKSHHYYNNTANLLVISGYWVLEIFSTFFTNLRYRRVVFSNFKFTQF